MRSMEEQNPKNKVISSMNNVASTTASSNTILPRRRKAQNFLLFWVDSNIDQTKQDYQNTLAQLRGVVNDVDICTTPEQCIRSLKVIDDQKAFVITSGSLGRCLVPDIHDMQQLDAIYIFCGNKAAHEVWMKKWTKVKGVYTAIKPICEALQSAVKQCNQDSISVSFISMNEEDSSENLDKLEPSFMYSQIFKEILFEINYDQQSVKDLANYCRELFKKNKVELNIIDEFERTYRPSLAIWWYSRECFTYQMLNKALRTLDGDTIIPMGFFICDLHRQIEDLHKKQINQYDGKPFIVYRGQGLFNSDFEKLTKTKRGLMSFNSFLSTSKNRKISLAFARGALTKTDMVGILFQISVDPSISSAPFASIREVSDIKTEEEILFSMHTVFRIGDIQKIDNQHPLYQVNLELTSDDDEQLRKLTEYIREEAAGPTGWTRLGNLLLKIGQFNKAEELYTALLDQTSDESERQHYYHQLGCIKGRQGDYEKAIRYYERTLEIEEKTLPPNHPDLAISYGNIGLVYLKMGEYSKALFFYEKTLEIQQKTLPTNHPDLATSYNNIGMVYQNIGEHSKALTYLLKDIEMRQKILPQNHPSLATSYNNIGKVHRNMGEYPIAFSFYEKALEIQQQTLPSNHPDLAISYNNIGDVYGNMEEYTKALSFYEKALEIQKQTHPPNPPLLATSYNSIACLRYNMGEYSEALSLYERAQEIWQRSLPPNHPLVKDVQKSIDIVRKKL
ncbi:unnamed protein product [Rotaria sp. Silwood2]|nr:unnamed protein product [Rotaria sp. Silwood2]CAF2922305.1 unnamed protein product [Rotaria sp. Silwood2]CAF3170387.1 unnamed protein product [Rotaria sp. Silwood2]CAF3296888.1 unnamed protein product [Rotaria sp. Silwood2]CAF3892432.1 unnamed protein product [Rotaria sp. Silwood2]